MVRGVHLVNQTVSAPKKTNVIDACQAILLMLSLRIVCNVPLVSTLLMLAASSVASKSPTLSLSAPHAPPSHIPTSREDSASGSKAVPPSLTKVGARLAPMVTI